MPTSTAPQYDLPEYASDGNYAAGAETWSGTPRRVATAIDGWAAAGATPEEVRLAQSENEWLARAQEWHTFHRVEQDQGKYGDGSDGTVTLGAGTTTLTRDMYYLNLTIPNGSALATAGYRVFVLNLLTIAAGGGLGNQGGNASGGTAGAAAANASIGGGTAGATGTTGSGGGSAGTAISNALGGAGGAGANAGAQGGGAGGTVTAPTAATGGYRHMAAALGFPTGSTTFWRGGSGGGSGAVNGGATGVSGGGGGGGGVVVLWARRIDNGGTITALGGNGGNAALGDATSVGGGGGGGGGLVYIVHREAVGGTLGTVTVAGGTGGAGAGGAASGASGAAGLYIPLIG